MSKKKKKTSWSSVLLALLLIVAVAYYYYPDEQTDTAAPVASAVAETANAANAASGDVAEQPTVAYELASLVQSRPEQLIEHIGYTVSYNPQWRVPNWVAYELTDAETVGDEQRTNHFLPDPQVKHNPVVTADYKNSGYDRGHMAPAADMRWSEQAMRESFYMTNMCPQNHNLNAGDWKSLEELARDWAKQYGHIYIACGPVVGEKYKTIGTERKIAVPESFFKVFLRKKGNDWTAIGFLMPNKAGKQPLMTYMYSVDEIEQLTGIDFFFQLPEEIQAQVEGTYSVADWTLPRR